MIEIERKSKVDAVLSLESIKKDMRACSDKLHQVQQAHDVDMLINEKTVNQLEEERLALEKNIKELESRNVCSHIQTSMIFVHLNNLD